MTSQSVKINGRVTIKSGNDIIYQDVPNHWVDAGLKGLTSAMCGAYIGTASYNNGTFLTSSWSHYANIKVGMDTTIATTHGITELVNPNTNSPNSFTGTNVLNPSPGLWKMTYTGTWNAGVITGTIGEIALYLGPFTNVTPNWATTNATFEQKMVARISSADGTFTAFTPDPEKVFTVEWSVSCSMS